jgi:hypothetical protein
VSAITLYPSSIRLTGNPAQHGLADLALTLDTNDAHDTHVVITTDQLLDLYEAIGHKISELPINLVSKQ